MAFAIIADSTSSLDKASREKYNIDYVRMIVKYGADGEEKFASLDYEDVPFHEYYEIMRNGTRIYTDMVPYQEFLDVFKKYLDKGIDVLYIGCSSKLSGSVNLGEKVAKELREEYKDRKIYIVDALTSNAAQKYLTIDAAKQRESGKNIDFVYAWVEEHKYEYQNYATVGSLTYLSRAGRVKASKAFIGNLLSIKPLIYNNREGENVSYAKAKGRNSSIEALALEVKKYITDPESQDRIYIVHGDCLADAQELREQILNNVEGLKYVEVTQLDPIVGASCGPDTLIVGFKGKFVEDVKE